MQSEIHILSLKFRHSTQWCSCSLGRYRLVTRSVGRLIISKPLPNKTVESIDCLQQRAIKNRINISRTYTFVKNQGFPAVDNTPYVQDIKKYLDWKQASPGYLIERELFQLESVQWVNRCLRCSRGICLS